MQCPPPLFSFSKKTQKLDWDAIAKVDVDQDILVNKNIDKLETLLGNITMAELSKKDLKILRDKNLIKVFKLGQLTTEYLMYQQNYLDKMGSAVDLQYQKQFEKTRELEDEVKDNQRMINQLRASIKAKKQTLKTYEGILKQPNIRNDENEIAKKCELCFKLFANQHYLVTHYKKRHLEFYMKEIRPKEDELLQQELGEYV